MCRPARSVSMRWWNSRGGYVAGAAPPARCTSNGTAMSPCRCPSRRQHAPASSSSRSRHCSRTRRTRVPSTSWPRRGRRPPASGCLLAWGRRPPHDPRGGKCHVQTTDAFERYVAAAPDAPELLRAVLGRLRCFGAAAERLLDGCAVPVRTTVRANVYDCDGGVPTHVDESALTVLFTDSPGSLLVGVGGRRAPLRPVDARGLARRAAAGRGRRSAAAAGHGVAPRRHTARRRSTALRQRVRERRLAVGGLTPRACSGRSAHESSGPSS